MQIGGGTQGAFLLQEEVRFCTHISVVCWGWNQHHLKTSGFGTGGAGSLLCLVWMTATVLSLYFFASAVIKSSAINTGEKFSTTSFRIQIGIGSPTNVFDSSHKRGKATSKGTSILPEAGGRTKTGLFSSLSASFKPVHSPCRSPMFQSDKKSIAVSSLYRLLMCSPCPFHFWKSQSFNCFFSFSVTLLCDPVDANKDVGLLFTVNFSDKSITRNARIAGKWGREEKTIPYFPFMAGDTFKVIFGVLWWRWRKAEGYVYDHKQLTIEIDRLTSLVWHREQQFKPWWEGSIPFSSLSERTRYKELYSIISTESRLFFRGISEEPVDFVLHYPHHMGF